MSIFDVLSNLQYEDQQNADIDDASAQTSDTGSEDAASAQSTVSISDALSQPGIDAVRVDASVKAASEPASTINVADAEQTDEIDSANDTQALDLTYSDFDLFSADANLPEVAYFDQTQDPELLRYNEPDGDETFSDTLFSDDMTIEAPVPAETNDDTLAITREALDTNVDFIADDVPVEPPAFVYRDPPAASVAAAPKAQHTRVPEFLQPSAANKSVGARWGLRLLLGLFVLVLAAGLYAYKERNAIFQSSVLRPHLVQFCGLVGCNVPAFIDLEELRVLKRSVFSHPTVRNALVIDLAFVNEAQFSQPYPVLEIRLTDRTGGLVVKNSIAPSEYLDQWQEGDTLAADERLDVSLTVEDPGQTATSFELQFR